MKVKNLKENGYKYREKLRESEKETDRHTGRQQKGRLTVIKQNSKQDFTLYITKC